MSLIIYFVQNTKGNYIWLIAPDGKRRSVYSLPNCKFKFRGINNNVYLYEPINETMNEYFVAKYGYDMMEDEIIENYLFAQGTRTTTISIEKAFASLKTCFDVTPKITGYTTYFVLPYFSKEYKKTSQMIQIYYDKSNAKGTFCYEVQAIEREQKTRK